MKNMKKIILKFILKFILASFCVGLFTPLPVFAGVFDLVIISTNPKTPGPNQDVTISINSYAIDLNTATIIWFVDKVATKQGIAEKTLTIHTGELGTKSTVDITILANTGKVNKQIVIAPAEVDILWEAQTFTPPFYKGKALPSYKSLVRVTAIPRFNELTSDPSKYYYKWTYKRTQGVGEALGKNSVVIPTGWADSKVPIAVEVSLPGTDWKGYNLTNIPGHEAEVVLYERAPLLGIQFNHALTPSNLEAKIALGNTFNIHAVPYYFSTDNYKNGELIYTWSVNRANVVTGLDPTNITLSKQTKDAESFAVALRVQNPKRILQAGGAQANVLLPKEQ